MGVSDDERGMWGKAMMGGKCGKRDRGIGLWGNG